jgi:hypothetical protein
MSYHSCVSWAKSSPEQARPLMLHLFFDVFWHVRRRGGLFLWIACAKMVTALLHSAKNENCRQLTADL